MSDETIFTREYIDTAQERFEWACALAYAFDHSQTDPYKAQEIRNAWGQYQRHYWVPTVGGTYQREKPEIPDYPGRVVL